MEPVLPLVAVRDGGELQRRAVQQDELLIGQRVHLLDLVAQLYVLVDGLVKVSHAGVLCTPATEKGVFLNTPDDGEPEKDDDDDENNDEDRKCLLNNRCDYAVAQNYAMGKFYQGSQK